MGDQTLPGWARGARTVCRAAGGAWGSMLAAGFVLAVVDRFVVDLRVGDAILTGVEYVVLATIVVAAVAGTLWLVGSAMAGYREED